MVSLLVCILVHIFVVMTIRGRSAEADQGGRHSDLWPGRWHTTIQCTERKVGTSFLITSNV